MNILRWKRKSKKKIRLKTLILVIFSLIMTTFAWFAYSKILDTTLNIHMASWDMEYYIGATKQENPEDGILMEIDTLYPTMDEQSVTVDIINNGEQLVDIAYQVKAVTIAGIDFEILYEGQTNTEDNYIVLASTVLENKTSTDPITGATITEEIYRGVITSDIEKFPFTLEVEHSAQVEPKDANGSGEGYLKLTVNWVGDNNDLDSEWGYIVGEYLANNPTATSAMSVVISIDSYQADPNGVTITETLPSTIETIPFLPTGFSRVAGTSLETGLVIKDASGNEYVWVEVPKNATVYATAGLTLDLDTLTGEPLTTAYTKIETDLKNYSATYRTRDDVYTSHDAIGIGETKYDTLKQAMLKTIYQRGGFYIGRYETGIATGSRTSATTVSETPVIKAGAYPFTYISCSEAYVLASGMASGSYNSSLLFGLQWDLVLKYLETKGTSANLLKTDSSTLGNYNNNICNITAPTSKYSLDKGATWLGAPYEKLIEGDVLFTTGSNSIFSRQNIHDIAGNVSEWTFNITYNGNPPVGGNGGNYEDKGTVPANYISDQYNSEGVKDISNNSVGHKVGFRVTIY